MFRIVEMGSQLKDEKQEQRERASARVWDRLRWPTARRASFDLGIELASVERESFDMEKDWRI